MISLTRKSDYALVAMAGLATRPGERASARALAERLGLPRPALRNILKELAQHGLIVSEQGARGGYRLACDPAGVTVADVVEAMEGGARLTPCCPPESPDAPEGASACRLESSCLIKSSVRGLHDRLNDVLRGTTIADLLRVSEFGSGSASAARNERTHHPRAASPATVSISTE